MAPISSFSLGVSDSSRVTVSVKDYERSVVGEYYDDNWLAAVVDVHAGAFSGQFTAALETTDFVRFRDQLLRLYETLSGKAEFCSLEGQLYLELAGNGRGGMDVSGRASDRPGMGNTLSFDFEADQTDLPPVLKGLNEIILAFPARSV
ncbi:MAG: hypothetical protein FIA97_04340 [Methylococcaceae bacterium]|nr:hypothetical protein [Methylococcaceae bacterium]